MNHLQGKRIVVTGGSGFLGNHVVSQLQYLGVEEIFVPRSATYDLTDRDAVRALYREAEPDIVIHLAARVGGIGANQRQPGKFFYDNLMMGAHMIEQARLEGIEKFVCVGTVCSYPKWATVPFAEDYLWDGYPEETNAPYGIAKKALLTQLQAYRQQYGLNGIYLIPVNLYGPGDNFDPATSHVIPALIRKCMDAIKLKMEYITLWGTGTASREFLYVKDAATGIIAATGHYNKGEPVNLGTRAEIKISELAKLIAHLTGFKGHFVWDTEKPDGQPRRCLDVGRARTEFGFTATTALNDGLIETIQWYQAQA